MSKWVLYLVIVGLAVALLLPRKPIVEIKENVRIEYRDSIVKDTIRDTIFSPPIIEHLTHTDTILFRDSIFVPIPISRYTYQDSTYKFVVDGWNVKPISIAVYPKTVYKYETIYKTTEITKIPRITHGITGGVGVVYGTKGLDAGLFLGYGITFRL